MVPICPSNVAARADSCWLCVSNAAAICSSWAAPMASPASFFAFTPAARDFAFAASAAAWDFMVLDSKPYTAMLPANAPICFQYGEA